MAHEVIILSDHDVRELITMRDAILAVEQDFRRQAVPGSMMLSVPMAHSLVDRELGYHSRLKPAIIRDIPVAGVRVTGFKIDANGVGSGGDQSATRLIVLSDPRTSSPIAIVDERSSFSKRTSAAVCVAAKYMARKDSAIVGLVGVGNVGQAALIGLHDLFKIREVKATSLRPQSRNKFAQDMSAMLGITVNPVDTYEQACRGSDIIVVGTPSPEPFLEYEWLSDGVLLAVVGEHEAKDEVYAKCDRLFVDYDPATEKPPAHMRHAIEAGLIGPDTITGQIWEVVTGRKPGRRTAKEKIMVSTVGLTTQDIAIAYQAYLRAKAEGRGLRLPF
jgi:alanine dehydrogenase